MLVAPGTYTENINLKGKAITVSSELGPDVTIIDGGGIDAVVTFNTQEPPTSVITGFTIRNGAPHILNSTFGGGITIVGASPTVIGNIITENTAFQGGGVFVLTFSSIFPASPTIKNNTISKNKAILAGAGIAVSANSPIIQGNTITENGPVPLSGGVDGGGISLSGESPQIIDNVISNNTGRFGGGMRVNGGGSAIIRGNIIRGNKAVSVGGIDIVNFSPVHVVQNIIVENTPGGLSWRNPPATIINNTIAHNDGSAGVIAGFSHETEFANNIVVAKTGQPAYRCPEFSSLPVVFRSNNIFSSVGMAYDGTCSDQTGINGNISADPLFVNPAAGDYHLQPNSPSVDAGDNNAPNLPPTDIDGDARIFDGNGDGLAVIDQGVDEVVPPFDLCIQDDSNGNILQINSATGDYQLFNCSGFIIGGKGVLIKKGSTLTLQHTAADRRVSAKIDGSSKRATASIQLFSQGSFTISDRNTTNNTCGCGD